MTVPKWIAGVLSTIAAALVVAGITQSVLVYAQSQVTNERLLLMFEKVDKIEKRLDDLQSNAGDRFTRSNQNAYASKVDATLSAMTQRSEDRYGSIRSDLREHERSGGHMQATAQIAELVRRMLRAESEIRELKRDREKGK